MRRQSCIRTLLQLLILTVLPLGVSQAESDPFWNTNRYAWSAHSVTPSGRVRVTITKTKPKLYLARSKQPIVRLLTDDNSDDYYDDLPELQIGYRRPEIIDQTAEVHDDISDEIKIRLVLARKRALEAYSKKWA